MTIALYRVRDWDSHYENSKSRERDTLSWVPIPNKQSGMGLCRTLTQKDGTALYGFWVLLVGALSQQSKPREGWLTHDGHSTGTPWAPSDLAMKFRRSEAEMKRALEWFSSMEMGWLELVSGEVPAKCPPSARALPLQGRKEEKEEKEVLFKTFWEAYPRKQEKKEAQKAFERLNGIIAFDALLSAVEKQKLPGGILAREKKFIPLPASYLRGERWNDEGDNQAPAPTLTPAQKANLTITVKP